MRSHILSHISIYSTLHLLFQTSSTEYQPSTNPLNNSTPSIWLVPTPRKSYKMFFQNVTHYLPTSFIISIGLVFVGVCRWQTRPSARRSLTSYKLLQLTTKDPLLQQTLQQQTILPLLQNPSKLQRVCYC